MAEEQKTEQETERKVVAFSCRKKGCGSMQAYVTHLPGNVTWFTCVKCGNIVKVASGGHVDI